MLHVRFTWYKQAHTRTPTHTQSCCRFHRRRRRCRKATNSQQPSIKRRFIFLITSSCAVCLHKFCVIFPLFFILSISSTSSACCLCFSFCCCFKRLLFTVSKTVSVCMCVHLCAKCKQTLHTVTSEWECICVCVWANRVVCMLNASYTLHFDSIGVRDRIVRSFVRVWILKSISCTLKTEYSIRVFRRFVYI